MNSGPLPTTPTKGMTMMNMREGSASVGEWRVRVQGEWVFTGTRKEARRQADAEAEREWQPDAKVTIRIVKE